MAIKILPYKLGSHTAKALAQALGTVRIHHDPNQSKYKANLSDLIYNYGNSNTNFPWMGNIPSRHILNQPRFVHAASNKVLAFQALQKAIDSGDYSHLVVPAWTVSRATAVGWANEGEIIFCRQLTRASQGKGIVVAHNADEIVNAPLYTKGIMKVKREYRAHVFNGEVIDLVAKAVEAGSGADVNHEIKSHANGWVFVREAVTIPDDVKVKLINTAIEAVEALSLDVAAVDIIRGKDNTMYILEVNTAPGMEGTTLNKYVTALKEYHDKQVNQEGDHGPTHAYKPKPNNTGLAYQLEV